ncbi:hypothetical protein N9954_03300 [Maribacter sp.]|nr:hypothetical protein [Maribacter sp.]
MKKLNFDNQVTNDDDKLISLLKTPSRSKPSEKFVERTLEKFLTLKTAQKPLYSPLKSPLYMMFGIGLLLFIPFFSSVDSQISLPDSGFELENFIENIIFQLDSWYLLSLGVLVLATIIVVWVELGLVRLRHPFV